MIGPLLLSATVLGSAAHPNARRATLYLDFGGRALRPGRASDLDQAACVTEPLVYPAYEGDVDDMRAVAAEARRILDPYGIRVVWRERPPDHLPYTMVLVGGHPTLFGLDDGLNGVACLVDCGNHSERDVAFVFSDKPIKPDQLGRLAVHEAAHTWGLEHVQGSRNLMNRFFSDERGTAIGQTCADLDVDQVFCPMQHERHCPPGKQNTHSELQTLFGSDSVDDTPPVVRITSPQAGDTYEAGDTMTISARISDDFGGFGWKFAVPELDWEHVARDQETEIELVVPEGTFTAVVEAIDHERNVGRDTVSITVAPPGTSGGEGETRGCTTPRTASPGWAVLALLVAGCRRQRRPWRR